MPSRRENSIDVLQDRSRRSERRGNRQPEAERNEQQQAIDAARQAEEAEAQAEARNTAHIARANWISERHDPLVNQAMGNSNMRDHAMSLMDEHAWSEVSNKMINDHEEQFGLGSSRILGDVLQGGQSLQVSDLERNTDEYIDLMTQVLDRGRYHGMVLAADDNIGLNYFQSREGKNWLSTHDGQYFLRSESLDFSMTGPGQEWLQSERGMNWLGTHDGQHFLRTTHTEQTGFRNTPAGEHWHQAQNGSFFYMPLDPELR